MNKATKVLQTLNDNHSIAEVVEFFESYGKWTEDEIVRILQDIRNYAIPRRVDLVLVNTGSQKIQVIKAIREVTSLGLKETKDIADSGEYNTAGPDPVILENVTREIAQEAKDRIEEFGAICTIRETE